MALEREMSTPPIPSRSVAQFTLPPLLNERCTSLLRAPVSEMTYTVSSGTLNSTIPYQQEGCEKLGICMLLLVILLGLCTCWSSVFATSVYVVSCYSKILDSLIFCYWLTVTGSAGNWLLKQVLRVTFLF